MEPTAFLQHVFGMLANSRYEERMKERGGRRTLLPPVVHSSTGSQVSFHIFEANIEVLLTIPAASQFSSGEIPL